jgi:ATP-dependent DNA helicase RecG
MVLGDAFAKGNLLEPRPKEVRNPNIAIAFRRIGLSENAGWGLSDVIANWTKLGHARPAIQNDKTGKFFEVTLLDQAALSVVAEQVNEVTEQVSRLLNCLLEGPLGTWRLMHQLQLQHRPTFLYDYLLPALAAKLVAMTQPDSPKSPTQKYQLTDNGRQLRERLSLEIV